MKPKYRLIMSAISIWACLPSLPALAQDGYKFNLQLTTKNASEDPDKVWDEKTLAGYGEPPVHPDIYTARITTPAGEWLLSQTSGDCNMQSVCTSVLVLKTPDGKSKIVAYPRVSLGASATLSLNYRKITTEELDESAKEFTGSYDVEPVK